MISHPNAYSTKEPVTVGPWPKGMNNRQSLAALPPGTLGNAVNIDLDWLGNARRRAGYTKVVGGLSVRAGYSCSAGTFFVDGSNLYRLNADDSTTLLYSGLVGNPVAYEYFNGVVYITDGLITGRIVSGVFTSWPVDTNLPGDAAEYMAVPAGSIIKEYKGRIYVASGSIVWITDPFLFGSVHRQRGFIQLTANVDIMEPVSGGLWIVTDRTDFYAGGGPDEFEVRNQLNYGAVPGTSVKVPNTNDVMWYSDRGAVLAAQDGTIKNLQEENVAAESGESGAALIREENGIRQFIASVSNQSVSPMVASSFMEMEVIRKQGG